MRKLVKSEPITPFLQKVSSLYEDVGVSSILVVGGCGDYLSVADTVIMMEAYVAKDVTAEAKTIAGAGAEVEKLKFVEGGGGERMG